MRVSGVQPCPKQHAPRQEGKPERDVPAESGTGVAGERRTGGHFLVLAAAMSASSSNMRAWRLHSMQHA